MALTYKITMDAADPATLADFWCFALGYEKEPPPPPFATWDEALTAWGLPPERWNDASAIHDPATPGSRIFIQKVPEPKTAKNRLHFDLRPAGTLEDEVRRLTDLGASVTERSEDHVVMRDPEGNEFCIEPGMQT